MIRTKADLFCDGNIAELVRRAVADYQGHIVDPANPGRCLQCGGQYQEVPDNWEVGYEFQPGRQAKTVIIKHAPCLRCSGCGRKMNTLEACTVLERAAKDMAQRNGGKLPQEIEFADLLRGEDEASMIAGSLDAETR